MVVKLSLMIVYDDDAGATQRRFMAMEREDLRHRSDVERLMNSLVPRGWGRSRWDRKPRSVPKPPPLKLCSFCDELKLKPEFSGQNWAKVEAAGCRCCTVRRVDDQKSLKAARVSDFKATFVYPAPLTAAAAIAEQAVSPVGDFPDTEHPPTPTGIPTLTPAQGSECGPRSWSTYELPKPKAPRRVTQQAVDVQGTRKEVAQGGSSGAALSKTQKQNLKKRQKNLKKRQRIRQVRDGHVNIDNIEDYGRFWWERSDGLLNVWAGPSVYHGHATVKIGTWSGKTLSEGQEIKIYGPAEMDDSESGDCCGYWCRISPLHEPPAWIIRCDIRGYSSWDIHTDSD